MSEIQVNGVYVAKVNNVLTRVRVDAIRKGSGGATRYDVTNLKTNRKTTFASAAKFRSEANGEPTKPVDQFSKARLEQIEAKYSTEQGATEEERQEAQRLATGAPACKNCGAPVVRDYNDGLCPPYHFGNNEPPADANPCVAAAAKATPKFSKPPTPEQQALLDAVAEPGLEALVIEAGAGTGKTTSLRMLVEVLQGNGQYTAFNSSLVAESKTKFSGTRCACNTTHSLAFRAEGKRFEHRLDAPRQRAEQTAKMIGLEALTLSMPPKVAGDEPTYKRLAAGFLMSQVTGAIRRFCQSADTEVAESHFKYLDGLDMPSADGSRTYDNNRKVREYLLPYARKAWADLSNPEGVLPFSHDHYVKVWQLNNPVISADYILLDEAQDTAPVMLDILAQQKCLKILVGDTAQQIYEWRGAVNALAAFPGAPRKMLSQSFRFGVAIADVANAVLETLDESTPLRLKGLPSIHSTIEPIENPTCILCRTNAVAVASLLSAIAEGKRPFLIGGGSDVISFVEAAETLQQGQPTSHPDLACFSSWSEAQEYVKQDEGEDLKLMVNLIDAFGAATILSALRSMPSERDADLVISTAHKSKGREWDHVRLANDFPTKSKSSDADRKLLYVAVTRAKLTLDISGCPFFTGQDSLDISTIAATSRNRLTERGEEVPSVVPPAPATPPATEQFTWAKRDDKWLARGPKGKAGQTVDIYRKDGSKQAKKLGLVVEEFEFVALYRVY